MPLKRKAKAAESLSPQPAKEPKSQAAAAVTKYSDLPDTLTDPGWKSLLGPLFKTDSWKQLTQQLDARSSTESIYPPKESVFRAFNLTPLSSVRVVILGQDPYHGPGQADGLAFSFSGGEALPPSLKNIFKELQADIDGFVAPKTGSLEKWAKQGVLLINTALTVAERKPGSHCKLGWTDFTDGALTELSRQAKQPIVFLLWGKPAQSKEKLLIGGPVQHILLKAAHPSPAACGAFSGCKVFSKANAAIQGQPIDWRL